MIKIMLPVNRMLFIFLRGRFAPARSARYMKQSKMKLVHLSKKENKAKNNFWSLLKKVLL